MERKKELSDFIKFAYSKGKVKNVEEAFKEYLPENEWHKGKIENILREEKEEYNIYEIGDIVFVKNYTYIDGKIGSNHLFVIVDQNNMAVPIENFGMLISSQLDKLKYNTNKLLEKDGENGLHRDSIVKTDIIYIISTEQILFKIGKVDKNKIEEYKESFYNNLNN
ncbi:MAG: type II toxin-antitoxin system PemK/MazF family toxin [Clostridia bacterium]